MSVALRGVLTVAEFLDWEDRQEIRWEFDGFQPVAMTGGTVNHARVQGNLMGALWSRLRGGPCQAFGNHVKIIVAGSVRYPDAVVSCAPGPGHATQVSEPVIVFEILGPGTSRTDRITKSQEYKGTPSIQRYVILEQDTLAATVFNKADGDWVGHQFIGEMDLPLPEIGIRLPLAELYEGVEVANDPVDDVPPTGMMRPGTGS